jgi:hypothetical protein
VRTTHAQAVQPPAHEPLRKTTQLPAQSPCFRRQHSCPHVHGQQNLTAVRAPGLRQRLHARLCTCDCTGRRAIRRRGQQRELKQQKHKSGQEQGQLPLSRCVPPGRQMCVVVVHRCLVQPLVAVFAVVIAEARSLSRAYYTQRHRHCHTSSTSWCCRHQLQ